MSETRQTEIHRAAAHAKSTVDLILDILESEKCPPAVALAALTELISITNWRASKTVQEYYDRESDLTRLSAKFPPAIVIEKLEKYFSTLEREDKIRQALIMLRIGPKCAKIEGDKIVKIEG